MIYILRQKFQRKEIGRHQFTVIFSFILSLKLRWSLLGNSDILLHGAMRLSMITAVTQELSHMGFSEYPSPMMLSAKLVFWQLISRRVISQHLALISIELFKCEAYYLSPRFKCEAYCLVPRRIFYVQVPCLLPIALRQK